MTHVCNKLSDIKLINEKVNRLEKIVLGDGQRKGVQEMQIRMEETLSKFIEVTTQLKTSVNGLLMFQQETQAAVKENAKHKNNIRWLITSIIALGMFLLASVGLVIKLVTHIGI